MKLYLLVVFLTSFILASIFTPVIMAYCKRKKLYDIPNERKNHKNLTPRLGGISFYPSMMLSFVFFLFISSPYSYTITTLYNIFLFNSRHRHHSAQNKKVEFLQLLLSSNFFFYFFFLLFITIKAIST